MRIERDPPVNDCAGSPLWIIHRPESCLLQADYRGSIMDYDLAVASRPLAGEFYYDRRQPESGHFRGRIRGAKTTAAVDYESRQYLAIHYPNIDMQIDMPELLNIQLLLPHLRILKTGWIVRSICDACGCLILLLMASSCHDDGLMPLVVLQILQIIL
jgi:hypothetical protein